MPNVITYDKWILLLFAFVSTISYHNWFVYIELYYLQLFTIIAYHLNVHILLFRYVICQYIWHMGSQNYELILKQKLQWLKWKFLHCEIFNWVAFEIFQQSVSLAKMFVSRTLITTSSAHVANRILIKVERSKIQKKMTFDNQTW